MPGRLLRRRTAAWQAPKRDLDALRGEPIRPSAAVEARYQHHLDVLTRALAADVERELREWDGTLATQEFFAQDAGVTDDIKKRFKTLWRKWEGIFAKKVDEVVGPFIAQSNAANAAAVQASIKKFAGGLSLGARKLDYDGQQVLKAAAAENVSLIKSIPQEYLKRVEGAVYRSITHPEGRDYLLREIKRTNQVTLRRAKMIAGDQTRKVNAALTAGRMQKVGVKKFEWVHVPSSHPRKLHEKLDGKVCKFNDPPVIQRNPEIHGYPAQLVNCKCQMTPIFDFEE